VSPTACFSSRHHSSPSWCRHPSWTPDASTRSSPRSAACRLRLLPRSARRSSYRDRLGLATHAPKPESMLEWMVANQWDARYDSFVHYEGTRRERALAEWKDHSSRARIIQEEAALTDAGRDLG
jgi:hypothetical protein